MCDRARTAAGGQDQTGSFRDKVGLPFPSAIVNSGGGLHVYWISDVPLSPEEWRPYAEGLKQLLITEGVMCDTGVTSDSVRLLRVPGTRNYKYDPPAPVKLLYLAEKDINFATKLAFLKQAAPEQPTEKIAPGFAGGPAAAFAALNPQANDLSAGIEKVNKLLNPTPIFEQCGFLRDAFATGGADLQNPLWNLSVLCTTFMEDGNALAHEISKGSRSATAQPYSGHVPASGEADGGFGLGRSACPRSD
jgi:hypothetical protein